MHHLLGGILDHERIRDEPRLELGDALIQQPLDVVERVRQEQPEHPGARARRHFPAVAEAVTVRVGLDVPHDRRVPHPADLALFEPGSRPLEDVDFRELEVDHVRHAELLGSLREGPRVERRFSPKG